MNSMNCKQLSFQALSGSSLFVAQRLPRRGVDRVQEQLVGVLILVMSDGRSQSSFSVLPPCCWHCSFTSCRSALSCSGPLFRSCNCPSTCSASSCAVLMALRGLLVELHSLPPVRMARTRGTRPSRLSARPRYCGNRRPVPLLGHRSWHTLRADSTTSRRRGSLWLPSRGLG